MRTLVTIVLNNGKQYVDAGLRVKRLKEPSSSAELVLVILLLISQERLGNISAVSAEATRLGNISAVSVEATRL